MKTLVVIPAYNEAANLGRVLDGLGQIGCSDVVVVDDNSTDATRTISLRRGATVLPLRVRLGAWGATQAGIRYAMKHGYDAVVTMDADGQHDPSDVPVLVELLKTGRADVVIGSYPLRGSRARQIAWWCFRRLSGLKFEDLTSGLKVYGKAAARFLADADATIFDYQDLGVLLYLQRHRMRLVEYDVVMGSRPDGKSKIFNSWLLVAVYMTQTLILCLSMRKLTGYSRTSEDNV